MHLDEGSGEQSETGPNVQSYNGCMEKSLKQACGYDPLLC